MFVDSATRDAKALGDQAHLDSGEIGEEEVRAAVPQAFGNEGRSSGIGHVDVIYSCIINVRLPVYPA